MRAIHGISAASALSRPLMKQGVSFVSLDWVAAFRHRMQTPMSCETPMSVLFMEFDVGLMRPISEALLLRPRMRITPPNQTLQPTPGSGFSSASRFTFIDPARLSLGR